MGEKGGGYSDAGLQVKGSVSMRGRRTPPTHTHITDSPGHQRMREEINFLAGHRADPLTVETAGA